MRGVVLTPPGAGVPKVVTLTLRLGGATVEVDADRYDPITEERERLTVARAADAADEAADLLSLLSPGAAEALSRLDGPTIEASGTILVAARLGCVVRSWRGVADPDGRPVPFSPEVWDLACFTLQGFARAFLSAWLAPTTIEISAGNA